MAQKIRVEVDRDLWDETPWFGVGFLLHGAFSYAGGMVRSPYLGLVPFHQYWDLGWTMAAKGKIKLEIVNDEGGR
ncbi:MAG: hypothetical protein V1894_05755 [Chloroflexota bacterium]